MGNDNKYDDIINMPHHVSSRHPQMSIDKRAAQFAPFAALTGLDNTMKDARLEWENKVEDEIIHEKIQPEETE